MNMTFKTTSEQKLEVYKIAALMSQDPHLNADFISQVVELALQSQGTFELMSLWRDETSPVERNEIVADLQESLNEFSNLVKKLKDKS